MNMHHLTVATLSYWSMAYIKAGNIESSSDYFLLSNDADLHTLSARCDGSRRISEQFFQVGSFPNQNHRGELSSERIQIHRISPRPNGKRNCSTANGIISFCPPMLRALSSSRAGIYEGLIIEAYVRRQRSFHRPLLSRPCSSRRRISLVSSPSEHRHNRFWSISTRDRPISGFHRWTVWIRAVWRSSELRNEVRRIVSA